MPFGSIDQRNSANGKFAINIIATKATTSSVENRHHRGTMTTAKMMDNYTKVLLSIVDQQFDTPVFLSSFLSSIWHKGFCTTKP